MTSEMRPRGDLDLAATAAAQGGNYLAIAIIGIVFVSIGIAMILDVRGFGGRVVGFLALLATALGSGSQARKVIARRNFFRIAWGLMAVGFGGGALLISVLH